MSKRIQLPMHHEVVLVDADADQVTTPYPQTLGQATHTGTLVSVDCVERVVAAGQGPNFHNNPNGMVEGHYVDFTTGDNQVTGDDIETVFLQVEAGEELAELSGGQAS